MNNLHRIFIAINLPEKLRQELSSFSGWWPQLPANWARPENLHITLNFLGNANDQEICEICQTAVDVAKRHDSFEINLVKISYGSQTKIPPKMIWAVGENSQEIGGLQKDLESSFFEFCGGEYRPREDYGFAPHVTLARLRQTDLRQMDIEEIPLIDEKINHVFLVESIEIMESQLRRGGPIYTVLESAKLGQN